MELYEVMHTTFSAREFTNDPLPDATLFRILEHARFAPSGGNRQGWQVIVVRDRQTREALATLTEPAARRYAAQQRAGESPWNTVVPTAIDTATIERTPAPVRLTEPYLKAAVVLVVCVDLNVVASMDQYLQRVGVISGASIYPFVWNILLAARHEGYGGTITTLTVAAEPQLQELLGIPRHVAVAAVVPLGKPVNQITRLRRKAVPEFARLGRWDGPPLHRTQHTTGPVRLAYDMAGRGPLVVFLHGIGGNRSNWGGQLAHFSTQGFCTVAWDARGYGGSDDSPQPLVFTDFADDLRRLLDHLGAERVHLVGLSMGGMIVQDFYGRYAERVATLALVDTSAGFGSAPEAVRRDFLARRLDPLARGLTPADIAPSVVEVLVAKGASAAVRAQMRASMAALRSASYEQALNAIVSTDFRAVLPRITVPTLVIVGEEDEVTPPANAEFLAAQVPGATLVRIPGAGHLTNLEAPEIFNGALQEFLTPQAQRASTVSAG